MAIFTSLDVASAVVLLSCVVVAQYVATVVYSVYFGPLSRFPGPKLAAASLAYEFYYDVVRKGQYTWKIRELHQQYGTF